MHGLRVGKKYRYSYGIVASSFFLFYFFTLEEDFVLTLVSNTWPNGGEKYIERVMVVFLQDFFFFHCII